MMSWLRVYLTGYLPRLLLPFVLLLCGSCHRESRTGASRGKVLITSKGMMQSLNEVMQQKLTRVKPGSADEAHVANWLADIFSQYGLNPGGNRQTYFVEYPLPDNNKHSFARNVVGQTTGMRTINSGVLLTTIYDRMDTEESQTDSDAVKASAVRLSILLEIANATAGQPADTPIYFSARSGRSMPEAKRISTILELRNSRSKGDTLLIDTDSIPRSWKPYIDDLSDSSMSVELQYHGIKSSGSSEVKMSVYLPTRVWANAADYEERRKGLEDLSHSAQIIRKLLYRLAMLQPQLTAPKDSSGFVPEQK